MSHQLSHAALPDRLAGLLLAPLALLRGKGLGGESLSSRVTPGALGLHHNIWGRQWMIDTLCQTVCHEACIFALAVPMQPRTMTHA